MKDKIKELRVHIDGIAGLVAILQPMSNCDIPECTCGTYNSDEIDSCHTSLMLGKAWLGKILGTLGEQTPYANDGKVSRRY